MKKRIKRLIKILLPSNRKEKLRYYRDKVLFFGFKYKCPFCDSHLRQLNSFGLNFPVLAEKKIVGGGYRLNAQCPVCYSTDRERLIYLYLLNKTNFFTEGAKVLHVAPEPRLSRVIKVYSNMDYLTADIGATNVMEKMDITEINYPDQTFDVIICNHVLEHIIDDRKAMSELYRVLNPEGWGILQVPISLSLDRTYEDSSITEPSKREDAFGQSDHVRIYAMDYLDKLRDVGFEADTFAWHEDKEFCDKNAKNKYSLIQSELLFLVKKHQPDSKE